MTTTLTPEPTPVPTPPDRPPKVRSRPPGSRSLFDSAIVKRATLDSFVKLDPRTLARNPVMFVVEVGSVLTTILFIRDFGDATGKENLFAGIVVAFLWFTVLFANFAEAMAEGRGKAQAATLRKTRSETVAHVRRDGSVVEVPSSQLQIGDLCVVAGGRGDPGRRRRRRGHRHGRRVGHHRRVGAGDPRIGRRPLRGHRRHPRAVRRDRGAHHGEAGRDVPRPDDRSRRRRGPPEDPE